MIVQNAFAKVAMIICLAVVSACGKKEELKKDPSIALNRIVSQYPYGEQHARIRFDHIEQVFHDTLDVIWESISPDPDMPASVSLSFLNDTALYFYHGQCIYYYPVTLEENFISMQWDWIEDCVFDSGLKRKFGLSNTPEVGKPFSRFELLNDTTLKVTYHYQEWVRQSNAHSATLDTVYPALFRVRQWD